MSVHRCCFQSNVAEPNDVDVVLLEDGFVARTIPPMDALNIVRVLLDPAFSPEDANTWMPSMPPGTTYIDQSIACEGGKAHLTFNDYGDEDFVAEIDENARRLLAASAMHAHAGLYQDGLSGRERLREVARIEEMMSNGGAA